VKRLSRLRGALRAPQKRERLPGAAKVVLALLAIAGAAGCRANAAPAPELTPETPEADPRSAKVRLRLTVTPVQADVFWGGKKIGTAGKQPFELERPRASGPLDLIIRAPGFLPYHTRLYTDRDDRLTVRLWRPEEASGLLGWKPVAPNAPAPGR